MTSRLNWVRPLEAVTPPRPAPHSRVVAIAPADIPDPGPSRALWPQRLKSVLYLVWQITPSTAARSRLQRLEDVGERLALPFSLWPFKAPMPPPGAGLRPRGRPPGLVRGLWVESPPRRNHLLLPPHSAPPSFPEGLWGRSVLTTNSGLGPDIIIH